MAIKTFDTHKFVRRLQQAGVSLEQAEIQAEVLTEAFNVNLEALVTKDFLAARLAEQDAKNEANFKVLRWMLGVVMAALVIPLIQQLISL